MRCSPAQGPGAFLQASRPCMGPHRTARRRETVAHAATACSSLPPFPAPFPPLPRALPPDPAHAMASPLRDPLSCDEHTLDWDSGAAGVASLPPGRGWSPAPRYRDDDSDCDNGSASEEEDEAPDDTFLRAKMAAQAALAPEADYPDWHPAVSATDRVRLVDWIGRVRGCAASRARARGLLQGRLTRAACGRKPGVFPLWFAPQDARAGGGFAGPLPVARPPGGTWRAARAPAGAWRAGGPRVSSPRCSC